MEHLEHAVCLEQILTCFLPSAIQTAAARVGLDSSWFNKCAFLLRHVPHDTVKHCIWSLYRTGFGCSGTPTGAKQLIDTLVQEAFAWCHDALAG